jgi:hypothetical protein
VEQGAQVIQMNGIKRDQWDKKEKGTQAIVELVPLEAIYYLLVFWRWQK